MLFQVHAPVHAVKSWNHISKDSKTWNHLHFIPRVLKTYAIQAGRELRVIVGSEKVTDKEAESLSYEIAREYRTK